MAAFSSINDAIDRLAGVVETEAGEIADEIRRLQAMLPDPSEADAVVARLDGLGERVRGFVEPMMPEPEA